MSDKQRSGEPTLNLRSYKWYVKWVCPARHFKMMIISPHWSAEKQLSVRMRWASELDVGSKNSKDERNKYAYNIQAMQMAPDMHPIKDGAGHPETYACHGMILPCKNITFQTVMIYFVLCKRLR